MFSKLIQTFIALSLATTLSACTLPWGEKATEASPPDTKLGQEAKCLSGLTPVITGFMDGTAAPEKVGAVWTCFDEALGLFERKVRGEDPRFYSAREVARFFEDYFLDPEIKINDRLLTEVMRFKQIFVGGDNQKMTREELGKLREFARNMRGISLELLPHMKLLSMNWQVTGDKNFEQDLQQFEVSKSAAQEAVAKLAALIEPQKQKYELANFVVLLEELQRVFKKDWSFTVSLKKMLPLLGRLKGTLTGTEEAIIQPEDWRLFGMLGVRSYSQYLRYFYFFENNPHRENDPEMILVFRSVDDLLSMVGEILTQKAGSRLDRNEIVSIMRSLADVYPQFTIPESFVDEVLKIKILFFGGEQNSIRPQDLARARQKLESFRSIATLLLGNSMILEGKWKPETLPPKQVWAVSSFAVTPALAIMTILGPLFESSYDLKDFAKLIESYELAFPPRRVEDAVAPKVQKLMPLVFQGKELILATKGSIVEKRDWPFLTEVLARGYMRALEYRYFLKDQELFRSPGLPLFETWVQNTSEVLFSAFKARGRGADLAIEISELKSAVVALEKADMWPEAITSSAMTELIPVLVRRALTPPENRARGNYESNFGPVGLKTIMGELKVFFSVQKKMDSLLGANTSVSHQRLQKAFGLDNNLGDSEVSRLISSAVPLAFDKEGRLYLGAGSQIPYSEGSLLRLNLIRAGVRWAIRSYGDAGSASKLYGISSPQFQRAFNDFKPGLVKLGLIDASNTTFATSRFLEGNLFTPFSDGDDFLDYNEAGTLAILILSGQTVFGQVKPEIQRRCAVKGTSKAYYGVDCALEIIRRQAGKSFAAMPGMARLFTNGNKEQNLALLNEVLKASGWTPNTQRVATISDLSLVPHVIQYIESLFRRWDRSGDGFLDREEAMRAEPMFHALLKQVSGLDDDEYIKAAFAFILVKGKAPETFWEKFEFATGWVGKEQDWPINADRYRIGQILGFIADSVRAGKAVDFKKPDK